MSSDVKTKVLAHALRIHRVYLGEMLAKAKTDKLKEYWGEQVNALEELLIGVEEESDASEESARPGDDGEVPA